MLSPPTTQSTIAHQLAALQSGATTSEALVGAALAAAQNPQGEGSRVFIVVDAAGAIAQARATDQRRARGGGHPALLGIPISVKDLFDIRGEVTRAGSTVLRDAPPAVQDASIVTRLRAAGAVIIGRTNMVEFAYSGVGINPHYGTPANPWERSVRRIPGGSSSGAAISVSDGMATGAIGSDTGGSVRIPAALCGLTGFKPTASRIDARGALPLSFSLDSIGPIGQSVECCVRLDAVLAGINAVTTANRLPKRVAVAQNVVLDDLEPMVAAAFERALHAISAAGVELIEAAFPEFDEIVALNARLTISAVEAYAWHRPLLVDHLAQYDPRVSQRLLKGAPVIAADYLGLLETRRGLCKSFNLRMTGFDGLLMPTVPIIAPTIQSLIDSDALYARTNALLLRNTSLVNFLDGCALSLPCHVTGEAPVGLGLVATNGRDAELLAHGRAIEEVLRQVV